MTLLLVLPRGCCRCHRTGLRKYIPLDKERVQRGLMSVRRNARRCQIDGVFCFFVPLKNLLLALDWRLDERRSRCCDDLHRCYDVTSGSPSAPQGLQLVLRAPPSSSSRPSPAQGKPAAAAAVVADTVVMENLGYFQLQAGPGLWELALAKGRASEVYEIIGDSSGGAAGGGGGGISGAAHAAAHEVTRRLQRELSGEGRGAGEVSPATESQAIAVRNFYSRWVLCLFVIDSRGWFKRWMLWQQEVMLLPVFAGGCSWVAVGSSIVSTTPVVRCFSPRP